MGVLDPTPDMINRLPKWAQTTLTAQEHRLATLERQLADVNRLDSRVVANPYNTPERSIGLGDRATVRFVLDAEHPYRGSVEVSLRDGFVNVSCTGGALALVPRASNVVHVSLVDLFTGIRP